MFSFLGKGKQAPGMVGLSLHPDGFAIAHVLFRQGEPVLNACERVVVESPAMRASALERVVTEFGLKHCRCNLVLSSQDYNLLLVEAPAVEPHEMASAVRWRIKDLIDRPVEELVVDTFRVPADAYRNNSSGMVYAVAARRGRIVEMVDVIGQGGLALESIDIPELVLKNLSSLYMDDSNGLAFLDLRESGSKLNITRGGNIYLTRHINTQVAAESVGGPDWESLRERLVLEIQRSLDYYESQMGQGHISRLLVAPRAGDGELLASQLREGMGLNVEVMDLEPVISDEGSLPMEVQQSCLLAIGGALRSKQVVSGGARQEVAA